jgi:hypothetical protein
MLGEGGTFPRLRRTSALTAVVVRRARGALAARSQPACGAAWPGRAPFAARPWRGTARPRRALSLLVARLHRLCFVAGRAAVLEARPASLSVSTHGPARASHVPLAGLLAAEGAPWERLGLGDEGLLGGTPRRARGACCPRGGSRCARRSASLPLLLRQSSVSFLSCLSRPAYVVSYHVPRGGFLSCLSEEEGGAPALPHLQRSYIAGNPLCANVCCVCKQRGAPEEVAEASGGGAARRETRLIRCASVLEGAAPHRAFSAHHRESASASFSAECCLFPAACWPVQLSLSAALILSPSQVCEPALCEAGPHHGGPVGGGHVPRGPAGFVRLSEQGAGASVHAVSFSVCWRCWRRSRPVHAVSRQARRVRRFDVCPRACVLRLVAAGLAGEN